MVTSLMRFQQIIEISKAEAVLIDDSSLSSRNENVAICQGEHWGNAAAGAPPR
jgi:hypothetical protein